MGDSRVSISIYRTVSAGGQTRPKIVLPSGKKLRISYNGDYLIRHGAADGSTILMTDNGYMPLEDWYELTPNTTKGNINLPIIHDAPSHQWVLNIVYGFETHTSSPKSMDTYAKYKVLMLKEEGDTSHVFQRYDQYAEKKDNANFRDDTSVLR